MTKKDEWKTVETVGEVLSDGILELLHENTSRKLQLLFWDGKKQRVATRIRHQGQVYVPRAADSSVLQALRLPTHSASYKSTAKLFSAVTTTFRNFVAISPVHLDILGYFVFSTWFPDVLESLPTVCIVGPRSEACTALRLLSCFCRHSLRLSNLNAEGLCSLPMYLRLTLLIDQPELSVSTTRLLRTSASRCYVAHNGKLLDLTCMKAFYLGTESTGTSEWDTATHVSLPPTAGNLPVFDQRAEEAVADEFQSQLLQYRLQNSAKVQQSEFDAPGFTSETRNLARALGKCIVDDEQLQSRLVSILRDQDEEIKAQHSVDLVSVLLEVLLLCCHQSGPKSVYVGNLTCQVNALLMGRGESVESEPREIGAKLKALRVHTKRLSSKGRGILLDEKTREQIHQLAREYGVTSSDAAASQCKQCGTTTTIDN